MKIKTKFELFTVVNFGTCFRIAQSLGRLRVINSYSSYCRNYDTLAGNHSYKDTDSSSWLVLANTGEIKKFV